MAPWGIIDPKQGKTGVVRMDVRVLGCYGSHLPGYGTTSFLVDENILIDGGTITSVLSIEEQLKIETILLTHAHLDHLRDIMFLVDNIFYLKRPSPLVLVSTPRILNMVHEHLFNGEIWPDFFAIPSPEAPVLKMQPIMQGEALSIGSWCIKATPVHHTVETVAYTLSVETESVIFIGDTGPTEAIWAEANSISHLRAVFIETSLPNRLENLARITGHLTPRMLAGELEKLADHETGVYVFHVKLQHDEEIEMELRKLPGAERIHVLRDGQRILL
ncbi:MAG: 3',5'-cyclic-nucleotide phosphodiesterase [Syntrophaceae bacterium]|nr:3',5'-cyclic-nucleotide phosphodiesterase [Syntrophaceae bacterium]